MATLTFRTTNRRNSIGYLVSAFKLLVTGKVKISYHFSEPVDVLAVNAFNQVHQDYAEMKEAINGIPEFNSGIN